MTLSDPELTTLSRMSWAYLRRNRDYHDDWRRHAAKQSPKPAAVENSPFPCIQQTQTDLRAQKWGLLAFADPAMPEVPFWHPDMSKVTVAAEAHTANVTMDTPPFLPMLHKAKADIRELRLLDGRLCLIVGSNDISTQLMFPSGTALDASSSVTLLLPFGLDLPIQTEKAKTLWDVMNGRTKKIPPVT